MDKTRAVLFAMIQGTELARGQGRGFTDAGLQRQYDHMESAERVEAEKFVVLFQKELERHGFAVMAKAATGDGSTQPVDRVPKDSEENA